MAKFQSILTRTSSTTLSVGAVYCPGASMKRFGIYDLEIGSDATPADQVLRWELTRTSTVGTIGSSVTPGPNDPADAAAVTLSAQAHSVDPTLGVVLKAIPLNQRATFRWMAYDRDDQLIVPATANNGIAVRTPVSSALVSVYASVGFEER